VFSKRDQFVDVNIIRSTFLAEIFNQLAFLFPIFVLRKIRTSEKIDGAYETNW